MKKSSYTSLGTSHRAQILIVGMLALAPLTAFAERDLVSVADSAVSQGTMVAKALSVLGSIVGAIAYQIPGAAQWARGTLVAGLLGLFITYGVPSLLAFVRLIFGGG